MPDASCPKCNRPITQGGVDVPGRYVLNTVKYHLLCLKCKRCNKQLSPTTAVPIANKSSMFANKMVCNFFCQLCIDRDPKLYHQVRKAQELAVSNGKGGKEGKKGKEKSETLTETASLEQEAKEAEDGDGEKVNAGSAGCCVLS